MNTSWMLVGRIDGKSASRRQRTFPAEDKAREAIERWRTQGFNTWWLWPPGEAAAEHWLDTQEGGG